MAVSIDRAGFIKRATVKNYNLSNKDAPDTVADTLVCVHQVQTDMNMLLFSNLGFCYNIKIEDIPEYKWRDKGCAPGRLCTGWADNERILLAIPYKNVLPKGNVTFMTRNGMIKVSNLEEYAVKKNKFNSITLKTDDVLVNVEIQQAEASVLYITQSGMSLNMDTSEITVTGRVIAADATGDGYFTVACGEGALKVLSVIPEGKGKMSAGDLLRGRKLAVGDMLE